MLKTMIATAVLWIGVAVAVASVTQLLFALGEWLGARYEAHRAGRGT